MRTFLVNILHLGYSKFLLVLFITITAFSCTENNKPINDKYGNAVAPQTIYKNVLATADDNIKYTFYLPAGYNGKSELPVLFFFDPHANAQLPIEKYKNLADKYNYIFVGSNTIKNGMSAASTKTIFESLLAEVKARFSIDNKRLFTAGFSGGAKLAIIYAQQMPEIIGVVACGASLPLVSDHNPTYYYAGIVGNQDFNYLETHQTFTVFDQKGYDYTSVIFNGEHNWPPVKSFAQAITGMEIYTIKTKRREKDEKWLESVYQKMQDSIAKFEKANDYLKTYQTVTQASRWFYGLKPIKELNKKAVELERSKRLNQQMQQLQALIHKEVKLRSEFIKAIENKDFDWWQKEVEKFKESTRKEDKNVAMVSQRLLNYISMACFMLTKTNLDDAHLDIALKKIKIYELVDPDNYDVYLMYARYYMLIEDIENMKASYHKAETLGFENKDQYSNESSWQKLMSHPEIDS